MSGTVSHKISSTHTIFHTNRGITNISHRDWHGSGLAPLKWISEYINELMKMWLRHSPLIFTSLSSVFCKNTHTQTTPFSPKSGCFALIKLLPFTQFDFHSFRASFSSLLIQSLCSFYSFVTFFSVSDVMDNAHSLSVFRLVPEVVSSGPAGGQLVPQFLVSREDNEVVQLYTGQQSSSAPDIHACYVVSHWNRAARACFQDTQMSLTL